MRRGNRVAAYLYKIFASRRRTHSHTHSCIFLRCILALAFFFCASPFRLFSPSTSLISLLSRAFCCCFCSCVAFCISCLQSILLLPPSLHFFVAFAASLLPIFLFLLILCASFNSPLRAVVVVAIWGLLALLCPLPLSCASALSLSQFMLQCSLCWRALSHSLLSLAFAVACALLLSLVVLLSCACAALIVCVM